MDQQHRSGLVGATVGGVASSYAYLGDGRRASATQASVTTGFVWDPNFGLPQLALERDAAGATLRTTTYGLGPLSVGEAGQTSYLHADRLGSIAATSTAAGNAGWAYRYDPFGAERRAEQLDPAAPASPYRFTGQLLDPSGLYHLRARQYDPGSGRFLSTDPVAGALTDPYVSTYAYVRNNPLRWTDPSGRCTQALALAVLGPEGAVVGGAAALVCIGIAGLLGAGAVGTSGALSQGASFQLPPPSIHISNRQPGIRPVPAPTPYPSLTPGPPPGVDQDPAGWLNRNKDPNRLGNNDPIRCPGVWKVACAIVAFSAAAGGAQWIRAVTESQSQPADSSSRKP